ncbi:MAG: type III-B CRISPR module-associated protein Cmr5 [Sulfuricellaceae bacterium]
MKSRSHLVAQAAYNRVEARQALSQKTKKAYGALAHKFPILILQNGLAQATGFLLAKGKEEHPKEKEAHPKEKKEHLALLEDIAQVLRETGEDACRDATALHRAVIEADMATTMHLTRRALEASSWIKRYVQGVLEIDATGAGREEKETT